jgi:hypothetical protein
MISKLELVRSLAAELAADMLHAKNKVIIKGYRRNAGR